ncbi:hypothetical protein HMPREF1624_05543 [Sporothrix schenckii ATCC 58251]|uniref:Transcription factor domain-containing protein n=1 Tax=Sporothrix schenckii (strain ATCC 58251 / de Perez 2211183) TaxID=1391915 RepID=U7PW91_SPOS1|nr:hypothetical protein HMPREF1624_05543 [Sporothrix schenckii ATCC 58251]
MHWQRPTALQIPQQHCNATAITQTIARNLGFFSRSPKITGAGTSTDVAAAFGEQCTGCCHQSSRIGSGALDAAAASLASTLPLVLRKTGTDDYDKALQPVNRATAPMLQEYGRALHSLRTALCDPVAIKSPNTLCALYLVVVTQGWLQGDGGNLPSHGEAVAMILRSIKRHRQSSWGDFENSVMSTLCFLVVMEGFINPRISLDDNLWEIPEPHGPTTARDEPLNIDSLGNRYLAHVVKLLREPNVYQMELVVAYHRVRLDRTKLSALLATIPATPCPDDQAKFPISDALCRVHLRWQTAFGMLTLIAMRIGSVLSSLVPRPECMDAFAVLDLPGDLHAYRDDIVDVARQALQYYPLGSSFMPLCLLVAYFSLSFTDGDASQLGCANEDLGHSLTASDLCTIL